MNILDAIKSGSLDALKKAIENKQSVNVVDTMGFSALHWAVIKKDTDAIRLLIGNGAQVDKQATKLGLTPLHLAAVLNSAESVTTLLSCNATPNIVNTKEETPLDMIFQINEKADWVAIFSRFIPAASLAPKTSYGFDALLASCNEAPNG